MTDNTLRSNPNSGNGEETPLRLEFDELGRLVIAAPSTSAGIAVEPIRCFPFTDPDRWISLCDSQGRELALVPDPSVLDESSRRRLFAELGRSEFVPVILRVKHVTAYHAPNRWEVVTDRGETTFGLDHEDDVRRVGDRGIVIVDDHGIRYHIPDADKLDAASRRFVQRFL